MGAIVVVVLFQPMFWLGHPENRSSCQKIQICTGLSYPKNMKRGVEDKITELFVDMLPNHHTIAAAMLCVSFKRKAMVLAIDRGYAR